MTVRQLQLHSIIKNLESKVITLKEEQKIINQRYELRVRQLNQENQKLLDDRDKTIEYLRSEIDKDRQLSRHEQMAYDSCMNREKLTIINDLEKYKGKCSELQKRVQKTTEKYQLKTKQLEQQNLRLRQVICQLNDVSKITLQGEVDKLSRYYQTSRIEQASRSKTIDWIEKFTNFVDEYYNENDKVTKENISFLQLGIENLKKDLLTPLKTLNDHDEVLTKERRQILTKIHEIVEEQTKITNQSAEQNEKWWQLIKKQRNSQQIQKITALEKELTTLNAKYQLEASQLLNKIKALENERKTLLLGFTELKSLSDSKEKTYKEEIAAHKATIEELLEGIEKRQANFEHQVQTLHSQLSNLNQRYYENIEVPLNNLSGTIEVELKAARLQIQKLVDNKGFIKLVQSLELTLQKYVQEQGMTTKLSYQLAEYVKRSQNLIMMAKQVLQTQTEKKLFSSQKHPHYLQTQDKMMIIQTGMKEVEWKQKQNKLNYELSTLKKHNKRLKQININLQNQLYNRSSSAFKCKHHNQIRTEQKNEGNTTISDLQQENETLRKLNQNYQEEFMYQLSNLKDSIKTITGKDLRQSKDLNTFKEGIIQTKECNNKIIAFLERENNHITSVRDTLSVLNRILVKPVQVFDQFIKMISKCYMPFSFQPHSPTKTENIHPFIPFQKLQSAYNEISVKRQENTASTNRLTAQLIKMLRQSISFSSSRNKGASSEVREEKLQKSRISRQIPLERKVKELQSQKIKNREECLRKIQKIEQILKVMDQKMSKRGSINVSRLQESLDRKLIQLSERYMSKSLNSANQLSQITTSALKELKNKLKQCITENEGLIKEIEYINMLKKQTE